MSDITDAYDLQVQECIVTAAEFEEEKAEIAREQTAKEAELAAIRTKIEESLNEDFKEKEIGIRETKKLLLGCDLGNLDLLTQLTGQIKDLDRVDQHRKTLSSLSKKAPVAKDDLADSYETPLDLSEKSGTNSSFYMTEHTNQKLEELLNRTKSQTSHSSAARVRDVLTDDQRSADKFTSTPGGAVGNQSFTTCYTCSTLNQQCDGVKPTCSPCDASGGTCEWDAPKAAEIESSTAGMLREQNPMFTTEGTKRTADAQSKETNSPEPSSPSDPVYSVKNIESYYQGPMMEYRHVVWLDGKVVELVCYECGANTTPDCNYFKGAVGYARHVRGHGKKVAKSDHEVFAKALQHGLRELSEAELERLLAGDKSIIRPNLRSKVSGTKKADQDSTYGTAQHPIDIDSDANITARPCFMLNLRHRGSRKRQTSGDNSEVPTGSTTPPASAYAPPNAPVVPSMISTLAAEALREAELRGEQNKRIKVENFDDEDRNGMLIDGEESSGILVDDGDRGGMLVDGEDDEFLP